MKKNGEAVSSLAEKASTQHKVVAEVLKGLEGCKSSMVRHEDVRGVIEKHPDLKDLPKQKLDRLLGSVMSIADPEGRGKVSRGALRAALQRKIPEIDSLEDSTLPKPKELTPTSLILSALESSADGTLTKQEMIQILVEQGTNNDTDIDIEKVEHLVDDIMQGRPELKRSQIRTSLDEHNVALADTVLPLEENNLIVCEAMKALESSKSGLVSRDEAKKALVKVAKKYGVDQEKCGTLLDSVFDTDVAYGSGAVDRESIRRALKSKIPTLDKLTAGVDLPPYESSLADSVMIDLESSNKGEITKDALLRSLSKMTKKPDDYWKLNELRDKVMNGKSKLTRDEVRAVLSKNRDDLKTLVEDPIKQHPIIAEALYDLEGSSAGAVNQMKLQKTIEKLAAQHSVSAERVSGLAKAIMAEAEKDKTVKVGRHELRRAMEAKVIDIDAVFYPKQKPVLKHLTPVDKVLQQLERE